MYILDPDIEKQGCGRYDDIEHDCSACVMKSTYLCWNYRKTYNQHKIVCFKPITLELTANSKITPKFESKPESKLRKFVDKCSLELTDSIGSILLILAIMFVFPIYILSVLR